MTTKTLPVDKIIHAIWEQSVPYHHNPVFAQGCKTQLTYIVDGIANLLPESERAAFKEAALGRAEPRVDHNV